MKYRALKLIKETSEKYVPGNREINESAKFPEVLLKKGGKCILKECRS